MSSKEIKKIDPDKKKSHDFFNLNDCVASNASTEIMLDRVYNGKEIDFPFSNN